jgi:hypothetical protein
LIGTYQFSKGSNHYIKISDNANGAVIADAFKFVYVDGVARDSIPPNPPSNLQGSNVSETGVTLTWSVPSKASDDDIAMYYTIYRNGVSIGTATSATYTDTGLLESSTYLYEVYSVDDARIPSTFAAQLSITTIADLKSPQISTATSLGITGVGITFNELLDKQSAEAAGNYSINNSMQVLSAVLANDSNIVNLTTTNQEVGRQYTVTVNNVKDRSKSNNACSNESATFTAQMSPLVISISADNVYELYVNGTRIGSNDNWNDAEVYSVPSNADKNVIAVKVTDLEGVAGLVAEVTWGSFHFVTDDKWKVTTSYQAGWETVNFNDIYWQKATKHGFHGSTPPWSTFGDVSDISKTGDVSWIWSSDNSADNEVYFRFTISGMDMTPPNVPSGLQVKNP